LLGEIPPLREKASTNRPLQVVDSPVGTDWHNGQAKMPPDKPRPGIFVLWIFSELDAAQEGQESSNEPRVERPESEKPARD
jgi:hypothetical protein